MAIKVILPELARQPGFIQRFESEAHIIAQLEHLHIVPLYDFWREEHGAFLVMRLMKSSLKDLLETNRLDLNQINKIIEQTGSALILAHNRGVVHRDIKPANILLDHESNAYLSDFGIAKSVHSNRELTSTGAVIGSPAYLSPEQVKSEDITRQSDIYSLGVVLYELLVGEHPFENTPVGALMVKQVTETLPDITEFNLGFPPAFNDVVQRATAKDPINRYSDVDTLLTDFRTAQGLNAPSLKVDTQPIISIAVLPFHDTSPNKDNEYFSDGLTEEIITDLSKVRNLRIISRTSSMMMKDSGKDVKDIGRDLNVRYLLEGSVRKYNNQLRINAQLIDASNDTHVWADKYSGELNNVFDFQESLSRKIVAALTVELDPKKSKIIEKKAISVTAHQKYLQGRYHLNKATPEGFYQAIEYFKEALAIEPDFALAYAGLASSYNYLGWMGVLPSEVYPKAREAANKAIEIDNMLAEAYDQLGYIATFYDWNWDAAEYFLTKAIELNPNSSEAYLHYHWYLFSQLRAEECYAAILKASEIDPLSIIIHMNLPNYYELIGDYKTLLRRAQNTLEIAPFAVTAHLNAIFAYLHMNQGSQAIEQAEVLVSFAGLGFKGLLGHAYAVAGETNQAEGILQELEKISESNPISAMQFAFIHIGLGNFDDAFYWLEKAYSEQDSPFIALIQIMPMFDPLRSDTRFTAFTQRLKFKNLAG